MSTRTYVTGIWQQLHTGNVLQVVTLEVVVVKTGRALEKGITLLVLLITVVASYNINLRSRTNLFFLRDDRQLHCFRLLRQFRVHIVREEEVLLTLV